MTFDEVKSLAIETVTLPGTAAQKVLALPVPSQAVWLGLALVSILNGIYYALLLPGMARSGMAVPAVAGAPVLMTLFILTVFVTMIVLLAVSGRMLGGQGDVDRVSRIIVWLQLLRFGAQVAISLISLAIPILGWLASLALGVWGVWILLNFIAAAHEVQIPKALGALVMTFLGVVLVMSILSAAFGVVPAVPNGEI